MASFVRSIQLGAKVADPFNGRGSKLGHTNPKAKDRLAREARERKRASA